MAHEYSGRRIRGRAARGLRITAPIRARYLRYQWDGDGPTEALNEIELY